MRARMALRYTGIEVEIREIALRDKPQHMLELSPKGTVPVLGLSNGTVIDESLDIMRWALAQNDPENWRMDGDSAGQSATEELIRENDGSFKSALDRYKYAIRFPQQPAAAYRAEGERFLQRLESRLQQRPCLCRATPSFADIAIFPFIRQFAMVDEDWFAQSGYDALRDWLRRLIAMPLFADIMQKRPTWLEGGMA